MLSMYHPHLFKIIVEIYEIFLLTVQQNLIL